MSLFPDQRSTEDQMRDLYRLAVEHGMYDAADMVGRWLEPRARTAKPDTEETP